MKCHHIGAREQRFQRHDSGLHPLVVEHRVVDQDPSEPHGGEQLPDPAADAAKAHDPGGHRAGQSERSELGEPPIAAAQPAFRHWNPPDPGEDQSEGVHGHGFGAVVGGVGHRDACCGGGMEVDRIDPYAVTDDPPTAQTGEGLRVELRGGAGEDDVGIGSDGEDLLPGPPSAGHDLHPEVSERFALDSEVWVPGPDDGDRCRGHGPSVGRQTFAETDGSEVEQTAGIAAGDRLTLLVVETGHLRNQPNRVGLAHVEGEVGAKEHPIRSDDIDEMSQVERIEDHRVVVEAPQVVTRRVVGDPHPRLGADLPGVVGARAA